MSALVEEKPALGSDRLVRALVVDDEATILEFLGMGLGYEGFQVESAMDGPSALAVADRFRPDVVILDVMLPGLDGIEVCRRLRTKGDIAIIMLTAKGEVDDRIVGLDAGADDYLPKPFRFQELLARIRAVLRRRDIVLHRVLKAGDVTLDRGTREVLRAGRPVDLTPREFDLLDLLLAHPGQVFPRETILNRLWGYTFVGDSNVIDVHISTLREEARRQAAEADPGGAGCRLCAEGLIDGPPATPSDPRHALSLRLTALYVAILTVVLATLGFALYAQVEAFMLRDAAARLERAAASAIVRASGPRHGPDDGTDAARNLLAELASRDVAARILATDGSVLASGATFYDQPVTPDVPAGALGQAVAGQLVSTTLRDGGAHQLVVLVPMKSGDSTVGILQLTTSLAAADSLLARLRSIILLGSLGAIALGALLGISVTRAALRPLARMTATSEADRGG
ncbi:MAG: response regulator transcription factor [Chloroflexia bacterium]